MFIVRSGFIGDFALGDNINYNLEILALLYGFFEGADHHRKRLLCKPIILTLVSIIEAVLYDLHQRVKTFTWEGVRNVAADAVAHIQLSKIDKLDKYIASARRHDFFDLADTNFYERLDELRRLRNRWHIQNEKNDPPPKEYNAFTDERKTQGRECLKRR